MSDVCAHGWSSVLEELTASQHTLAQLSEEADACRSETDDSDSLPDNSLWWVNLLKNIAADTPGHSPRSDQSRCFPRVLLHVLTLWS